jgi:peptidoglycan/xylan/chitin deacetylase (PgdA/CDA1 family)
MRLLLAATSLALAAALLARIDGSAVPLWVVAALVLVTVGTVGSGLAFMGSGLFARPILGTDPARSEDLVALTFDDGPHPVHTRAVLDMLDARGHRATFFVIGTRGARHPDLLTEILRRGHALGNHSYAHSWATAALSVPRLVADLHRAQATLRAAGCDPRWFRPPIGIVSPRLSAAVRHAGLHIVGWTASARDGVPTRPARALSRLVRAMRPGAILALHDAAERGDREPLALVILPPLLDEFESRKLRSVTIDELLAPVECFPTESAPAPALACDRLSATAAHSGGGGIGMPRLQKGTGRRRARPSTMRVRRLALRRRVRARSPREVDGPACRSRR